MANKIKENLKDLEDHAFTSALFIGITDTGITMFSSITSKEDVAYMNLELDKLKSQWFTSLIESHVTGNPVDNSRESL